MIKFRAWIETGIETYNYVKPMTIQQMIHSKKSTFSLKQLNDLVDFEQFTGLKDVNGKDIYENDIIKSNYKYAQPKISQIIMEDGNSYIAGEDLAAGNEMLVSDHVDEIEVIGNVHANPELLRGGEMSNSETTEYSHNGADWIVQESDFIKDNKLEEEK